MNCYDGSIVITCPLCFVYCYCSGAKVNVEAANGRTPLHEASIVGDSEMVELLIHKGADVLSRDNGGFTSYELAFRRGHKDVCNEDIPSAYLLCLCSLSFTLPLCRLWRFCCSSFHYLHIPMTCLVPPVYQALKPLLLWNFMAAN